MQRETQYILLGVGIVALAYIAKNGIPFGEIDAQSSNEIAKLHPSIRSKAKKLLVLAKSKGIDLRIVDGMRTCKEQNELYAQGRTKKGAVVTNASCGYSNHNYGTAFDVAPYKDGKPNWNYHDWDSIGEMGKSIGLDWGGDWKSFRDRPHFQYTNGLTLAQLRTRLNNNNVTNGYVNLT